MSKKRSAADAAESKSVVKKAKRRVVTLFNVRFLPREFAKLKAFGDHPMHELVNLVVEYSRCMVHWMVFYVDSFSGEPDRLYHGAFGRYIAEYIPDTIDGVNRMLHEFHELDATRYYPPVNFDDVGPRRIFTADLFRYYGMPLREHIHTTVSAVLFLFSDGHAKEVDLWLSYVRQSDTGTVDAILLRVISSLLHYIPFPATHFLYLDPLRTINCFWVLFNHIRERDVVSKSMGRQLLAPRVAPLVKYCVDLWKRLPNECSQRMIHGHVSSFMLDGTYKDVELACSPFHDAPDNMLPLVIRAEDIPVYWNDFTTQGFFQRIYGGRFIRVYEQKLEMNSAARVLFLKRWRDNVLTDPPMDSPFS